MMGPLRELLTGMYYVGVVLLILAAAPLLGLAIISLIYG